MVAQNARTTCLECILVVDASICPSVILILVHKEMHNTSLAGTFNNRQRPVLQKEPHSERDIWLQGMARVQHRLASPDNRYRAGDMAIANSLKVATSTCAVCTTWIVRPERSYVGCTYSNLFASIWLFTRGSWGLVLVYMFCMNIAPLWDLMINGAWCFWLSLMSVGSSWQSSTSYREWAKPRGDLCFENSTKVNRTIAISISKYINRPPIWPQRGHISLCFYLNIICCRSAQELLPVACTWIQKF